MVDRGYREAPRDAADLLVSIHGEITEKVRIGKYEEVLSKEEWVGWYPYRDDWVYKAKELSVVISDREHKTVVWQSTAQRTTPVSRETSEDRLRKVIRDMLRKLPRGS